jgi:hypothetical protein
MSGAREASADNAAHKRQINDLMREGLQARPSTAPIGFFCECASPRCFATVWLTGEDYDTRRGYPSWAPLAPGHEPSRPPPHERREAGPSGPSGAQAQDV